MASYYSNQAITILKNKGIIAHQTDTVFGFACLPFENLLLRLSRIKHRPEKQQGFILLASSTRQLQHFINCTDEELSQLNTPQKKPTTWLVAAKKNLAPSLIGTTKKIAIRITQFSPVKELCDHVGAIASTSANLSQQSTAINPQQIRNMFGPAVDYIDTHSGEGTSEASTIIDLSSGQILRK